MKKLFGFLFTFQLVFVTNTIYADKSLQVKFDDGGVLKWNFPDSFEPSIVNKNLRGIDETMIRLTGNQIEIYLPLDFVEWTVRSSDERIIFEKEWYDSWGWKVGEYTLSEKNGKFIMENIPEDTPIDVCKDYESQECRYLTVTDKLERDPSDGYNVFKYSSTIMFVFPKNK